MSDADAIIPLEASGDAAGLSRRVEAGSIPVSGANFSARIVLLERSPARHAGLGEFDSHCGHQQAIHGSRDGVAADPYKIGVTGFDSLTGYQILDWGPHGGEAHS